jgi:hypothetical protein
MSERILLLIRSIERDLASIAELFDDIGEEQLSDGAPEEQLIVLAYRLHSLYNAFENIFRSIAMAFENSDDARWHAQLLQRMRLDVMPVRPAAIDEETYDALDELRRFRHLFRHAYDVKLDPARLRLVLHKALRLKAIYHSCLERFLEFLRSLEDTSLISR